MAIQPGQSYSVGLFINDKDYSTDLMGVKIVSSLSSYYTTVVLQLTTDPSYFILDKIYGQAYITLVIVLKDFDGVPSVTPITFELMHIADNSDLGITTQLDNVDGEGISKEPKRKYIEVTTICRQAFRTMTTLVNDVQSNILMKTLIKGVVSEFTDADLDMDETGINNWPIDQVCIPPSTLKNMFEYLDMTFGIYDGVNAVYCTHENKLKVLNLSERIKNNPSFIVNQLALDSDNSELLLKEKPNVFYTKSDIFKKYKGNTEFSLNARSLRYVVKPKDRLSYVMEIDLKTIASVWGLIDFKGAGNFPNFFIDEDMIDKRIHYYTTETGNDYSPTFIHAIKTKPLANLFTIKLNLARSLDIINFLNIGEPVKFDTKIAMYKSFIGNYILMSSVLTFMRDSKDWSGGCQITLSRSNQSIMD